MSFRFYPGMTLNGHVCAVHETESREIFPNSATEWSYFCLSTQCMQCCMPAIFCLLEVENSNPVFFFFFSSKELIKSHQNTYLRLGLFILVSDSYIGQTSHFWMLNPNNYILENLQWKKYIGIHFEFRRHVVGIICVLLVQGEPP